jgi:hypothetical protein
MGFVDIRSLCIYIYIYIYIHVSLTLELVGGEWSTSRSDRFIPGETPAQYPLGRSLGGLQTQSGQGVEKILDFTRN